MKRRDFLKMSLSAGVAAALPINIMGLTSCSDSNDTTPQGDKPDISGPADILVLGNIITVDDNKLFADAMTIKNGYIQYVGNEVSARKFCDSNTEERKYPGKSIYPGFMEAHCHGSSAGMIESTIKLFDCTTHKEYQDTIAAYIKQHPNEAFYKIHGWQQDLEGEPKPSREMLDAVSTDKYIFGASMDGHCFLMNTKAMNALEITKEWCENFEFSEAPYDKETNIPTGYLAERAAAEVQRWFPVDPKAAEDSILKWQQFAFKNGYVCAADAGVNLQSAFHEAYIKLAKSKELKLRTRAFWNITKKEASEEAVMKVVKMNKECNDEYYKVVGLKLFIDGVAESHTALLTERYEDVDTLGLDRYKDEDGGDPDATLKKVVLLAHQNGLPTHTHTIGDGAVKKMLDAIEYAKNITGDYSIRDMLAHIELVRPEDIKRFAKLNVTAIVASLWGPKYAITDYNTEVKLLGDRADHYYQVINSFVKTGVNCAQHTDYPVNQAFDVPRAIYCGVTRCLPPNDKSGWGGKQSERLAEEAVTRLEMLKELTINVAKTWNEENRMGSLTPGKIANYVVYDTDFIDDDVDRFPIAKLHQVVIDGDVVFNY